MSLLSRPDEHAFGAIDWQPEVMARLDDTHLATWSPHALMRTRFAASLQQFLGAQPDTEVCNFYGRYVTDLEGFCHQLERMLPAPPLRRQIDGPRGVTESLRSRHSFRGRSVARQRFYVWHDADHLIEADRSLFGALVDALMGVAAEAEYVSDDLLLIQRCVFIGGSALQAYADDAKGQFCSWRPDEFGAPFWAVVTGLETPPVQVAEIASLFG